MHTDERGIAVVNTSGDIYAAEVLGDGIVPTQFSATVTSGGNSTQVVSVQRKAARGHQELPAPGPRQRSRAIPFDSHRIYGHNMAMWNGLDPFTSPIQMAKLRPSMPR